MKKNVLLFGVLAFLLGITYFFQEKRSQDEYLTGKDRDRIIPGEFQQIKLGDTNFIKRDNQWWADDILLSHNTMKQLEKKLSEIKEVKKVEGGEWKDYFPKPITFEVDGVTYTVGDLSLDRKNFYFAKDKNILLVTIEGGSGQLTTDEEQVDVIKYDELRSLVTKKLPELKENQLFRYYPKLPLGRVASEMDGRLDYELDLKGNATTPPPIQGIKVHDNLLGKFLSLVTQMTIKEELPYSEKLKVRRLGSLTFMEGDEKHIWELWLRSKDSADAIIMDEKNKRAFQMIGGTVRVFFTHLQDYWDKKVIPPEKFEAFNRLPMTFTQGERSRQVYLINAEPLRFETEKGKVKAGPMMELINFLFNLGPRDQADRVSPLSQSERKQILSEDHLKVDVWGEEVVFWKKTQELIVVNLTQGYKAHFSLQDISMEFNFQDVLE